MAYILLDESGNLGFNFTKKGTTKYFIVTALFTENKRPIEKCIRKAHTTLRKKYKRKGRVLHAYHEKPVTRKRLLKHLSVQDCRIMAICLNKQKVYTRLRDEKVVLYNYVTNILLDRLYTKKLLPLKQKIELIASKRETNKFLNENFKEYLSSQTQKKYKMRLSIGIKTPYEEKALQAVDFISWAIFRKYEYGDKSYYNLIKNKIIEESPLFP